MQIRELYQTFKEQKTIKELSLPWAIVAENATILFNEPISSCF